MNDAGERLAAALKNGEPDPDRQDLMSQAVEAMVVDDLAETNDWQEIKLKVTAQAQAHCRQCQATSGLFSNRDAQQVLVSAGAWLLEHRCPD